MKLRILAAMVTLAIAAGAGTVSAATLSLIGLGYVGANLSPGLPISNYNLSGGIDQGLAITYLTGNVKNVTNGLSVSGPARVTFTYLGSEAGNRNYSLLSSGAEFNNTSTGLGAVSTPITIASGLLKFAFGTSSPAGAVGLIRNDGIAVPADNRYAIGYSAVFNGGKSIYIYFDDIAANDRDFDDLVARADISAVPIPAAGLLLLGALAGLGAMARRRRNAA